MYAEKSDLCRSWVEKCRSWNMSCFFCVNIISFESGSEVIKNDIYSGLGLDLEIVWISLYYTL